jgi:hypothetical protein
MNTSVLHVLPHIVRLLLPISIVQHIHKLMARLHQLCSIVNKMLANVIKNRDNNTRFINNFEKLSFSIVKLITLCDSCVVIMLCCIEKVLINIICESIFNPLSRNVPQSSYFCFYLYNAR